jgi:hypothetical protein
MEIPSTKLQINHKSQKPMTKTFANTASGYEENLLSWG